MDHIYVSPYHDSENNDDCVVVYRAIYDNQSNKHYTTVVHLGNINLVQRYFIKGDKTKQQVLRQQDQTLTLEDNSTQCYPFQPYFRDKDQTLVYDITHMIQESLEASYRFGSKIHAPKILYF
jgi:hypothetical protein